MPLPFTNPSVPQWISKLMGVWGFVGGGSGCTHSMQKFPGQRGNLSQNSDNPRSLTCGATRELPQTDDLSHRGLLLDFALATLSEGTFIHPWLCKHTNRLYFASTGTWKLHNQVDFYKAAHIFPEAQGCNWWLLVWSVVTEQQIYTTTSIVKANAVMSPQSPAIL